MTEHSMAGELTGPVALQKTPTGIRGVDEITGGGLPKGRPTLVCGSAGCGKTLFAMEFLVRGATEFGEPGVFMCFEESAPELAANFASLGFDLNDLIASGRLVIDHVRVERSDIEETGEYDLEGLFIRLGHAIDSIGARRVVLDTVEALFAALPNAAIVRAELRRLFGWLKTRGVTAVITGERGDGHLTRHGLEEYVADCVLLLDHRVTAESSTRRLRIVKYRGSVHGTNEYPFLISEAGISVLPITSIRLGHAAPTERIPSGLLVLDDMLGGQGYYRGSSILVTGAAGTGKTSLSAAFVDAACRRGEGCLYFAFEESPDQICRNMRSIGIDLAPHIEQGLLHVHASRPGAYGLESHLLTLHESIRDARANVVVMDPITNLISLGDDLQVRSMLTRLIDICKTSQITALFTSLTSDGAETEQSMVGVSSLMDTWLLVRNLEYSGERNRALYILKSRGMAHSNQVREFRLSDSGLDLLDVYVGGGTVLTGSARLAQEAQERSAAEAGDRQIARLRNAAERKRADVEGRVAVLRSEMESELAELDREIDVLAERSQSVLRERSEMRHRRMADGSGQAHDEPRSTE